MDEKKNFFELDFLVLPRDVANAILAGKMKLLELRVFAVIQNYTRSPKGCFVSNERFAALCGTAPGKISVAISSLKKKSFVKQTGFDGRKRYLRAVGTDTTEKAAFTQKGKAEVTQKGKHRSSKFKRTTPSEKSEGGDNDFGMMPTEETDVTPFDKDAATILEKITRKMPPRVTGITQAKPSAWANHFRLLRTKDKISEADILRILNWYADHVGEEFIPIAYSGAAFRKKFHAIERQARRDISMVKISKDAAEIGKRLLVLTWPASCNGNIVAAVQTCLTAYEGWLLDRDNFTGKLRSGALACKIKKAEQSRLRNLGDHLIRAMPAPSHFIQSWMMDVNRRVLGWKDWSGDLTPLLFGAATKRFRAMGRSWAKDFAQDPDRWDRFQETMRKEIELA